MLRTYTGTQYILRHISGNGELCDRFDTYDAAIIGRKEAQEREIKYRKENGFDSLEPTKYVIVKSCWVNIYEITDDGQHRFISHSLNETVIPED